MKIHGVFSWYDESPSWIGTAIAGLGSFCDHILALDGAYALYPRGKPRSHPDQVETIIHTAETMNVACTLYQPNEVWWGNEVEKRNKALKILGAFAEDGDWLCIFDADYHVTSCNPAGLRHDLERTECEVATYGILDGEDWQDTDAAEVARVTKMDTHWISQTRDLYRWNPTLRVGPAHGDWSIAEPDVMSGLVRRWLRGPYDLAPAEDVSASLTVYHRSKDRTLLRKEAQQGYYKMRDSLGIEEPAAATT